MKINHIKPTEQFGNITFLDIEVKDIEDALRFKEQVDRVFDSANRCCQISDKQCSYLSRLMKEATHIGVNMELYVSMFKKPIPDMCTDLASAAIGYLNFAIKMKNGKK